MTNGNDRETVGLQTKWFGLNLSGKDAGFIFVFIAIIAMTGLTIWEHIIRSNEHRDIVCMLKLNLYVQQQPPGTLDWQKMPVDLYGCVPKFLFERPTR